jgi:hypothetical protein
VLARLKHTRILPHLDRPGKWACDNLDTKGKVNYDESDDEEDVVLQEKGSDLNLPESIIPSTSLPLDGDDSGDIKTAAEELTELLANGPIVKKSKSIINATKGIINDDGGDDVDEGDYGLVYGDWHGP